MTGVPSDYTIIGTVLAIAVAIILLSGLALYISFRVKETLRDEKGRGARAAKVGFLIGLLFLSGGVFYFFASGFNATTGSPSTIQPSSLTGISTSTSLGTSPSQTTQTPPTTISATSPSVSSTTPPASTTSTSTASTTSTSPTSSQSVSMNVQCPSSGTSVSAGSTFNCTVTIYNVGGLTYSSATLVSSADFTQFSFQGCSETVNGSPGSCTVASPTQISVGSIAPGTTVLTLSIAAPSIAGQKSCALTLAAPGLGQTITSTFTIRVINKP